MNDKQSTLGASACTIGPPQYPGVLREPRCGTLTKAAPTASHGKGTGAGELPAEEFWLRALGGKGRALLSESWVVPGPCFAETSLRSVSTSPQAIAGRIFASLVIYAHEKLWQCSLFRSWFGR